MAVVEFYEKPGCINNTKQKKLLEKAGHELLIHDLLAAEWTRESLLPFFKGKPVSQWINRSAPAVKSGEVIPETLDADTAITLMLKDRLLIRRPLMRVGDRCESGFEPDTVDRWIGLKGQKPDSGEDMENCPVVKTAE